MNIFCDVFRSCSSQFFAAGTASKISRVKGSFLFGMRSDTRTAQTEPPQNQPTHRLARARPHPNRASPHPNPGITGMYHHGTCGCACCVGYMYLVKWACSASGRCDLRVPNIVDSIRDSTDAFLTKCDARGFAPRRATSDILKSTPNLLSNAHLGAALNELI